VKQIVLFFFISAGFWLLISCSKKDKIYVFFSSEDVITNQACHELTGYLAKIYPEISFEISKDNIEGGRNIELEHSGYILLENDEAFRISGSDDQLTISGKTPRALLNGVYGLLEKLGCGFYLSMESAPPTQKELDFTQWNFTDSPLVAERIIFNWHNFLSGCSTWDYPEWKDWIDRASKMRFNTILVHAYGNNPMFTYSFNGKQHKTSPFPATLGGRDYGTQQVNDVRLLHGGEVFDQAVFGSEISGMKPEDQPEALQHMMSEVFDYAKDQGMKICFAFDIDTYPANPQELINSLPSSTRFCIPLETNAYLGRYHHSMCLANPETPEGYAFYKSKLLSLLGLYPQIDQVALWMRKSGSEWLSLRIDQLPKDWQIEYAKISKQHPEISKWAEAPGRFALGKVATAFQEALKEIGREDIELRAGGWAFDWMTPTDAFLPKEISFIGLDYNVLHGISDIDLPEQQKRIAAVSQNRPVTPVFWAHHDDGGYMGRPYVPIKDLPGKLKQIDADGYGIIHWTTWPLDPYFKNMAQQVWESIQNQDYGTTIQEMAGDLFGQELKREAAAYLYEWATSAPMMGRETREWFIDKAFKEQEVQEVTAGGSSRM
jgi:hypothetical protein